MTRKRKPNEAQYGLPETSTKTISYASSIDIEWGVDIGQGTPNWGQDQSDLEEKADNRIVKAFVRQISFSGTVHSKVIQVDFNSVIWSKLPKRRKTGQTRYKSYLTVVK